MPPFPRPTSGEFHRLTVSPDGSYRYQYLLDDTLAADETGTVAATEDPCVIPGLHTGTVEFRADGANDSDYTLAGRGPARWTVGPDPGELSRGVVLPTLGFEFTDRRGHGSFDPGRRRVQPWGDRGVCRDARLARRLERRGYGDAMAEPAPIDIDYTELLPLGPDDDRRTGCVTTEGVDTFDTPAGTFLHGRARGDHAG